MARVSSGVQKQNERLVFLAFLRLMHPVRSGASPRGVEGRTWVKWIITTIVTVYIWFDPISMSVQYSSYLTYHAELATALLCARRPENCLTVFEDELTWTSPSSPRMR
jgi:hypothetical protein